MPRGRNAAGRTDIHLKLTENAGGSINNFISVVLLDPGDMDGEGGGGKYELPEGKIVDYLKLTFLLLALRPSIVVVRTES